MIEHIQPTTCALARGRRCPHPIMNRPVSRRGFGNPTCSGRPGAPEVCHLGLASRDTGPTGPLRCQAPSGAVRMRQPARSTDDTGGPLRVLSPCPGVGSNGRSPLCGRCTGRDARAPFSLGSPKLTMLRSAAVLRPQQQYTMSTDFSQLRVAADQTTILVGRKTNSSPWYAT